MKFIYPLLFLLFFPPFVHAQSLSPTEQKLVVHVLKNRTAEIDFLEKVVNIASDTRNIAGIHKVGTIFQKEFERLGFTTYWDEMPKSMHRAGNLFAVKSGHKGKRLLLIGHLDTVVPGSSKKKFIILPNGYAKAIGGSDMKGGDVVILFALKALKELDILKDATIIVALMGDEENTGQPVSIARKELRKLAMNCDVVLDFESGPLSTGRRGISAWVVQVHGQQDHSSLIFQPKVGAGAIYESARILNAFRKAFSHEENLTVNSGILGAGIQTEFDADNHSVQAMGILNVTPSVAVISGDLRFISAAQKEATKSKMRSIIKKNLTNTFASITFKDSVPSMISSPANKHLARTVNKISLKLGFGSIKLLAPKLRGAGDISYVADIVPAGLVGLGPEGLYEHTDEELIDLDSLLPATLRSTLLLNELLSSR